MRTRASRTAVALGAGLLTTALILTGCTPGASNTPSGTVNQADIDKAMNTKTNLTFWTWVPKIQDQVDLFEKKYPKIHVKVENVGQGLDHYAKVRTASKAGNGPDVVQLEYQFISSFALSGELADLTPYGAKDIEKDYVPWVWKQGVANGKILAIPQDSGPLGNLYREDILKAAGITDPPKTWDEYKTDAQAVKDKTDSVIGNMAPNQGAGWLGLLWQAGVKPFTYDGKKGVTIHVNSPEAKKVMAYWQDMIQKDLVTTDADFTDEWYAGLNQGKYAGWLTAAWAPVFLSGAAADTSGKWRAAPLPQWDPSKPASGNWGGSADSVLKTSKHQIAAYELAKWINNAQEPALLFATEQHFFPTANSVLEDPKFVGDQPDFYGGQKVNELFAGISKTVDPDWQWLPFMEFAYTNFNETFGAAVAAHGDLGAGLDAWQKALVDYGTAQGFTVNG